VSPDETVVAALIGSAVRRASALVIVESIALGSLAGAAVLAMSLAGGVRGPVAIASAGVVWLGVAATAGIVAKMRGTRESIVRALERAHPMAKNVLVTADELSRGQLIASTAMRARVFADAAAVCADADLRRAIDQRRAIVATIVADAAWAAVSIEPMWHHTFASVAQGVADAVRGMTPAPPRALHVRIAIRPPAYTSLGETTVVDPAQVQAIEGSEVSVVVDSAAARVRIEHDGATREVARSADGTVTDRFRVTTTGYLVVGDGSTERTIPVIVTPDALPTVRMTAPGRDLIYAGASARIAFDSHATDDFGLRSLALHYTKVSGSGENFAFEDGEIPLEVTRANVRDWSGHAARTLADLGLKEGDMFVYRAVAVDGRPGGGSGSSDAYFVEISKLGVAAGDAFTLPEEETRYALSQQMLIIKTERLQQRRGALTPAAFTEEAQNLAVEQRMIRAEFVFMIGGEIEDEDVEAEQSSELQEGRLQNRGQRDLRAATIAMSQAEKALTASNTVDGLAAERAAVAALQRAFARDRYILRALGTRSQLDLTRRLTGSTVGAEGWTRTLPPTPENRRAALLDDLVRGIAGLVRAPERAAASAPLLAAEAIRIDPASSSMRDVAAALQVLASSADRAASARALSSAVVAALVESRRAHADPPLDVASPAPQLTSAFDRRPGRPR